MIDDLEEPPVTGDEVVDAALARVAELGEVPLGEHPAILGEALTALQSLLDEGGRAA